ncbi:MAG: hypothetical protein OXE43_05545 [Chloroflexi bacterium]|nr:hypothetical protein [Chloroflexota bacterium]
MIVAQLAIPLAAVVAAVFALWFALDILLRTRPSEAVAAAAQRTRELGGSFLWRLVTISVTAGLVAGAGYGAAVGAYRDGVESGAVAGLAVLAGALAAAATAGAGAALGQRASERAATAADRTLRQALAITLWSGTAPALLGGALAVGGVAGLYGIATRFADVPSGEAGFLVLGAGAGAALTALTARLLAASEDTEDEEGPEAEAIESAASAAGGADTLALMAAGGGAGLVLGAPIALLTDESVWLVAPLVVIALGLAAATVAAITLPYWARALRNAGRSVVAGYWIAAVLGGALAFLAPVALLEEGRWWFAGAALTGAGMSALIFLAGRTIVGDGSSYRGTGAAFVLLAGAALVAAFVLGWQVEIPGVSATTTALYGVAMAAAGALALAPSASAVRWFGSSTANAAALAERAREGAETPEEGPAPMPLAPFAATARRALAPGWTHGVGWTALVGAVLVAGLLLAVRAELGNVAAADVPRYVGLTADLGVTPDFEDFEAQAAYELASYRDQLDRNDVRAADVPQLLLAGEGETRRLIALRIEEGRLDEAARVLAGAPGPFPALPPLRLDGLAGVGALVALVALLGAIGLAAMGGGQAAARTLGAVVVLAVPVVAGLIARPLAGGNAGWEVAAGAAVAALVMGLALAGRGGEKQGVTRETGLALAVWLGASGAVIAPALVAV